ncbi:MAG: hypothetical protein ABIO70_35525 [Pseudomonadota bacterium]
MSALAGLLGLLVSRGALAAVPLILPDGEPNEPWRAALPLGGQMALDLGLPRAPGAPWVELERTVNPARWRLRVRDEAGVLHEVEVAVPADARAREEVVALAASLLHPVGGGLGFWPGTTREAAQPPPPPVLAAPTPAVPAPRLPAAVQPVPAPVAMEPAPPTAVVELPAEPSPAPAAPTGPGEPIAPAAPPVAATPRPAPAPAPPVSPPPTPRVVFWSRLAGNADLGLGIDGPTAGGGVQAGLLLRRGLRAGVGFQAEGRQVFEVASLPAERRPAQRDTDVFGVLLWSPAWRVAPLLAVRGGWTVRRAYVRERGALGVWTWQEVVDEDGDALAPLPFAGLEAGVCLPLGASLHLEPYGQLQSLLVRSMDSATFAPGAEASFPRWSAHIGLALRLEPGT